ncbi:Ig-like domain-containing protein [uncultured Marinobacter sp.]|uniref:Ig-like domain-containing protein n=1 Tax=uncultured Marinobacter sp. TaxID=187379 RepID=UPI0030C7E519
MKYNNTLALIPALLLAACGGDEQTMNEKVSSGSVVYSYPADGQADVSPKADIVLRFSHALTDEDADLQNKILLQSQEQSLPFSISRIDGGKSLMLSPSSELDTLGDYTVTFSEPLAAEGGRQIDTPNAVGDAGIQFETRGSFSGPASITNSAADFDIAWQVPANNSPFEAMNFSTFRLAMTHPIHPDWKALGGSIQLLDGSGEVVPAMVLVKDNRITVDPCVVEDPRDCGSKDDVLDTGQTYTLRLENLASLTSPEADRFSEEIAFTPRETGPTVVLQQSAVDSGLAAGIAEQDVTRSVLNGQAINGVTLNSVLQGEAGPSQQTGDLFAELAYAPAFEADEALPLRIARGSVLNSTSLDVLVGGEVPVLDAANGQLQTTGNIKVTMLSDASGYLSPNPYTNDINAPRHITLFMDVSMNTENAQPNAALSQDLMGVELRGIALVQDGVLTIDAIGMVEPNLLGQEYTDSTIAFHLQAATDADSVLDAELLRELDSTSPSLISWMPGPDNAIPDTRQSMQRPGDPVILFFDEPLAADSIDTGISLFADGVPVETLETQLDGTAVIVNPGDGLRHGVDYEIVIDGLTDLAGNPATVAPLQFSLDDIGGSAVTRRPALALTTYPGYPCETDHSLLDLSAGVLGQCYSDGGVGDTLPVSTMPSDRPITVVFSKSMDLNSIIQGDTFIVEKVRQEPSGSVTVVESNVPGRLEKNLQRIRFYPDQPWEADAHYRYTLKSSEDAGSCSTGSYTSVCDSDGLALKTDLLEGLDDGGGNNGPDDMVIYFTGTEPLDSVFTPLRNLPVRDTNANFIVDCDSNTNPDCLEPFDHQGSDADGWAASANSTKLRVRNNEASASPPVIVASTADARVGCETGERCPKDKFIYQTYALNTEVIGPGIYEPTGDEGILVNLYPTQLATTSISVFTELRVFGFIPLQEESITNTQVLRMRYAKDDPACSGPGCSRSGLIPGVITEGENGQPVFKTRAELMLDAPDMEIPLGGRHDLYGREFVLELEGNITFFDDGRMQIEQRNSNLVDINVRARALGVPGGEIVTIDLPLQIPEQGVYLNFISNPVKEIPAEQ